MSSSTTFTVSDEEKPDLYGQVHPNETKELIKEKLIEFENELLKIPKEKKEAVELANIKCPNLVNDDFKLKFLRCEVFHADRAAKRYAYYWKKRLSTFGPEKAFLPMTQQGALKDDAIALKLCFASYIGKDPTGRSIIFYDGSKLGSSLSKHTSRESACRATWYILHAAIEGEDNIDAQKKGIVMLGTAKGLSYFHFDIEFAKFCCTSVKGCLPLRISGIHLVHPPTFLRLIYPMIKMMLGERLGKRIFIHTGNEQSFQHELSNKFGLSTNHIASKLGGTIIIDQVAWLENRLRLFE